jgi:electron transfer flavoprotein beta subunit
MNVCVLLSGIADAKWPVPDLGRACDAAGIADEQPRILSPFDEAALEIALKLRDADPATKIAAVLVAPKSQDKLARAVAGFRPDQLVHLDAATLPLWDAARATGALLHALESLEVQADLILVGREFGDLDDGTLPIALAERLGRPFLGLVQQVLVADGALQLMREHGAGEQWVTLPPPVVATVTNDRRNRLRQPLLKNVMAAKRATIACVQPAGVPDTRTLELVSAALREAPARASACRMLAGTVAEQAADLARELDARRRAA